MMQYLAQVRCSLIFSSKDKKEDLDPISTTTQTWLYQSYYLDLDPISTNKLTSILAPMTKY